MLPVPHVRITRAAQSNALRGRQRDRCSHRRAPVRATAARAGVANKTAGGDSGDDEPAEPPSSRRALTIGGAP
jgi:hypothetical protein